MADVPSASRGRIEKEKQKDVRTSNILAAQAVADAVRTSLGPRGMDKMIKAPDGEVTITNDGATIMKQMKLVHPAGKMMVDLSKAQDIEAGDGTTSVVVLAGSLLGACGPLFKKGIRPTVVAESFQKAAIKGKEILEAMAIPVNLNDRESLLSSASTSLGSKVVAQYTQILSPIAVDAVLHIINPETDTNVDLRNIKVVTKLGGTIDDTELVDGLIFPQGAAHVAGGPSKIVKPKIALIQFCLSSPKSNIDNSVVLSDYRKMDRVLEEERNYIRNMVQKIHKTGCNVVLIQKSIMRDALNDLSLQYLARLKIMVVKDIERSDIEFISNALGLSPIASIDSFTKEKLGSAELAEEVATSDGSHIIKVTGISQGTKTVSIFCRASNKLVLAEVERCIHDALCVVRSLVKKRFIIPGGGAPEIEMALQLSKWSKTLPGMESYCVRAYADALEILPYTLAENAGLSPIAIVTELRNRHAEGDIYAGIDIKKGGISNIIDEKVLQPLLVTHSIITLATETAAMILKIDDIVAAR
eukprot:CAMPEP_0184346548 /NCGR_PEP_ID=MMETSP1089-20130417/14790_1 /TAXON_ID=38269 ORGANISM="Gloeochaete wittrockiana, Strain SAG46.84" /NCGR_SAMPLE_ID=MMETSP1089 /ASSEMBLY_ACC=CAM_ASM_000445 /LENGTH=528 /DNA_ID=CAMNT_0026677267 /DNA_START=22 /DNA_END=1608 /DNA_ORIENTATION=-